MKVERNGLEWQGEGPLFDPTGFTARLESLVLSVRCDSRGTRKLRCSWEILQDGKRVAASDRHAESPEAAMDEVRDRAVGLLDRSGPDIAGLEEFSAEPDRHLTEFFAGREAEMKRLRKRVAGVVRKHDAGRIDPAAGATMLIAAVPGAGKTALMYKLQEEWNPESEGGPVAARLPLADLGDRNALVNLLRDRLPSALGERLARWIRSVNLDVSGVGGGVEIREQDRSSDLKEMDRPVVLMIDEIQNIPGDRDGPAARMLHKLHEGAHGGPLIPVLAGLANSKDRLESAGISRLAKSSVLSPGALDAKDVADSVARFMDRFRVAGNRDGWPERIAGWSDGWPMHLHNALCSLAGELAANEGDLDRADVAAIRREAASLRATYYGDRTGGPSGSRRTLLARVTDALPPDGFLRDHCEELIAEAAEKDGKAAALPEGMTPSGMFDEMLRRGLIQNEDGDTESFVCPIPSMRDWCAARSGGLLHLAAWRGDPDLVVRRARNHDPNGRDVRGRTPLHVAAEEDWPEAARKLTELGSDPRLRDAAGRTPLAAAPAGSETARILAGAGHGEPEPGF